MASDLGLSEKTVRRVMKEDLNLRPFKIQEVHYLNERMKLKRLHKIKKMRRSAVAGHHRRILFTDEKMFTLNPPHNHRNDRVLLSEESRRTGNVHTLARRHFTTSIMVWAGIRQNSVGFH
ncbi:hypothetical protein ANCDUO_13177 [Ancylostoma duodenale]|uniref:Transposase n=1 Tax=Ancylostoma duodenale TaxID=51022 RepID=A0A0C2D3K4_9BILA|nr:hypothetical protein ANCDUO_13177 [Ancylostoma duodenale]